MVRCPVCKSALTKHEGVYTCIQKHSFDISKQGYTNLLLKSSQSSGDNKTMVAARTAFLSRGYYQILAQRLIEISKELNPSVIVDAGCGEGYYTHQIERALNASMLAFDVSKEALKFASKKYDNICFYLSSVFDLPVDNESVDLVLNIFSPLADAEYKRILRKGAHLIKVDPHRLHLHEMKAALYERVMDNEVLNVEVDGCTLISHEEVSFTMELDQEGVEMLFKMTPYSFKSDKQRSAQLLEMKHLKCHASFIIYVYKKDETY